MPGRDVSKWGVLSRLYPYLKNHRGRLAAGFVAIILSNSFQMMGPWIMGQAVDSLFASRWWFIGASRDMEYSLRSDVLTHLEALPVSFYQRNKTGELMSRATNDLSNVRNLVGPAIMYTANTIITALFAVAL